MNAKINKNNGKTCYKCVVFWNKQLGQVISKGNKKTHFAKAHNITMTILWKQKTKKNKKKTSDEPMWWKQMYKAIIKADWAKIEKEEP